LLLVILVDVPEGCLQRLRCTAVAPQHSRQQGKQQRPARVLQLGERHLTGAASELAVTRGTQQPQEALPGRLAPRPGDEIAHDHDLRPAPFPLSSRPASQPATTPTSAGSLLSANGDSAGLAIMDGLSGVIPAAMCVATCPLMALH
jgi:hypothetical protein